MVPTSEVDLLLVAFEDHTVPFLEPFEKAPDFPLVTDDLSWVLRGIDFGP